ncbi:PREDICTED: uncharacterized protein LOC109583907 [Amphimedon queenslandica]|nr:PREDICTED: uncharacterized protein LOC109583907 [Amphimedon queenslandica]|eukprot:XP_019854976.1 PREDICTED: uncharacterized protein LOC109583907 [Amphimedon queenslandica]
MKPAELYLPHHIDVTNQTSKSNLVLLNADDETFYRKGSFMFTSVDDTEMEVEAALCKIYCNHFCSHCAGVDKRTYKDTDKQCQLAVATKKEDDVTVSVHFCILPFQPACKKVVLEQYKERNFTLTFSKPMKFADGGNISLEFDPDEKILGWEKDEDDIYCDNEVLEKEVDYNEVIGYQEVASKNNIKRLEELEKDLLYPPRLRFRFNCTNQSLADKITKIKVKLNGCDPVLKYIIKLKRPDFSPSTFADLSVTPEETFDDIHSRLQFDFVLLKSLLVVGAAFKDHHDADNKWFVFGLALGLSHSQLRDIEAQNSTLEQYVRESLMLWRTRNTTASCKPVVDALKTIHFEDTAAQLESHFEGTAVAVPGDSHTDFPVSRSAKVTCNDITSFDPSQQKLDITKAVDVLNALKLFDTKKWKTLGLNLGLYLTTLNKFTEDHLTNTVGAWLSCEDGVMENGGATWQNLIKAVKDTGDKATAEKIRKKL